LWDKSGMAIPRPSSDEQTRLLVNLRMRYDAWIDVEREAASLPYDLRRKAVHGRDYLYHITDRSGNGKSLDPLTPDREKQWAEYRARKADLKARSQLMRQTLAESAALYRALRLPLLSSEAGPSVVGRIAVRAARSHGQGRSGGHPSASNSIEHKR
jgi:hypothetical protein